MSAAARAPRSAMLARVHIAKKEMQLRDEDYRAVLQRVIGRASASGCSDKQLAIVLDEFRRLGWKPKGARPISPNPQVRMVYAIWRDVRALLDGEARDEQLRQFVRRQTRDDLHPDGIDAPEFLDPNQLNKVISGLRGWLAGLRAKGAA